MSKTEQILSERGKTNGDYGLMSEISQEIKKAVKSQHGDNIPPYMKESIDMIAHKLGRIGAGDPFTEDHWRDIAGYATLCADRVALRDTAANAMRDTAVSAMSDIAKTRYSPNQIA